jgi:hypothetical protein
LGLGHDGRDFILCRRVVTSVFQRESLTTIFLSRPSSDGIDYNGEFFHNGMLCGADCATEVPMPLKKRAMAEFLGTFWLVFGGCGSAVLAAAFPNLGIGFLGVALAFGLTLLTMAFAIGHISGCHLNPAVSIGLAVGRRFAFRDLPPYIAAQ